MSSSFNDWMHVQANIDRIIEDAAEPFDATTIGNVRDLLDLLWGRFAVPEVSEGYWNTICLDWQTTTCGPMQIEIFSDRLEVCYLEPVFDVWCELHRPGQFFTAKLITALPSPIPTWETIPLPETG